MEELENKMYDLKNMQEKLFYIQNGFVGNAISWWGIDFKGYTTDIDKAGKYTYEDTLKIIERPQDIAWECDYIDKNLEAQKRIIDCQYLDTTKQLIGNTK